MARHQEGAISDHPDHLPILGDELRADGIEVFDLSATLRVAGVAAEDRAWMPGGHYAPSTNRLVAQTLAQALK